MMYVMSVILSVIVVVVLMVLIKRMHHRYQESLFIEKVVYINGMFEQEVASSRQILGAMERLNLIEGNEDMEAVATLLKYRMRTRAFERFSEYYCMLCF